MKMFCSCTDTDPDFVVELLALPPGIMPPPNEDLDLWVCHDCFEQFTLFADVRFVTDTEQSSMLFLEQEWFE